MTFGEQWWAWMFASTLAAFMAGTYYGWGHKR